MMRHLTNGIARSALIVAVATTTLASSFAQQPQYGLYIGDRDTYRVITYLQPIYDPSQSDIALALRWSCAYSQFAKGYQNNPLQQIYIYGVAIDYDNRRVWASDHLGNKIVAFDFNGNHVTTVDLPQGAAYPRKMTIVNASSGMFDRSYLYVSASGKLWVYGPLEDLPNARWEPFTDRQTNQQAESSSGVRWVLSLGGVLVSASQWKAKFYKMESYNEGYPVQEWNAAGEDIDFIDQNTILLAKGGTIRRLQWNDPRDYDFISGLPATMLGIAVGPQEVDDTRFIYIATYQTFPNALIVYRYDPNNQNEPLRWFGSASPLPYKSGYAVAIGPVWDCSQCANSCPEDVNRDRVVDDADLLRILFAFGTTCGN